MKKINILLLLIVSCSSVFAQTYHYYSHTTTRYTYGPYYFSRSLGFIDKVYEDKREAEERERLTQEMGNKCKEFETYYKSLGPNYPTSVIDGWHLVSLTNNVNYFEGAKVHVTNNKVDRIVWDDYIEPKLTFSGPINNGKTGIQIEGATGPLSGIIYAYFINAIAEPMATVPEPPIAGKISFWTNNERYKDRLYIEFEGMIVGPFSNKSNYADLPECGEDQFITIIYKPGKYRVKILKRISKSIKTGENEYKEINQVTVEIKEGGCETQQIDYIENIFTPEQLKSKGVLQLYTTDDRYENLYLMINEQFFGPMRKEFPEIKKKVLPPPCTDPAMYEMNFPAGNYSYKVVRRYHKGLVTRGFKYDVLSKGNIQITEDNCQQLRLE